MKQGALTRSKHIHFLVIKKKKKGEVTPKVQPTNSKLSKLHLLDCWMEKSSWRKNHFSRKAFVRKFQSLCTQFSFKCKDIQSTIFFSNLMNSSLSSTIHLVVKGYHFTKIFPSNLWSCGKAPLRFQHMLFSWWHMSCLVAVEQEMQVCHQDSHESTVKGSHSSLTSPST